MTSTLVPVDPSTVPFLRGRFAPVADEITADLLAVEGTLPAELHGAYLRNGPNPRFTPLGSYTYPLEGDGMLHGVWLEDGAARYANRYVRTAGMLAEERAGHALFGGIMSPAFVDPSLLGPDPDPGWPFKLDAFINIVRHAGRLLALEEGMPPYEVAPDLATIGRYEFGGALVDGMCAHPKIDPVTGEMVVFRYDVVPPFLTWATVGPDGSVTQPPLAVEGLEAGCMIHDFAITARYVVLVVGPLVFDLDAMGSGEMPLDWRPEQGTRIAVIPRNRQGETRWLHTDAFWAWHYANAYEDGDRLHVDCPWSTAPAMLLPADQRHDVRSGFTRLTLDPTRGSIELQHLDSEGVEFPRIDDRLTGKRHRYVLTAGRSGDPRVQPGEHDALVRYDMRTGGRAVYDCHAAIGEVTFAPRPGGTDELDGWYVTLATDLDGDTSRFLVFDAAAFPAPPVASVELPQRVPNGLHGDWFPAS